MAAQGKMPDTLKRLSAKLPVIPGVCEVARKIESVLPGVAPRISDVIPCKR